MSIETTFKADAGKVLKVLDLVGKDAEKGIVFAQKYQVPIEALVAIAFGPAGAAATSGAFTSLTLVQNIVLEVKAKYAALPPGTPPAQILQDELTLVEPAVTALLAKDGITYSTAQVTSLINLVVAAINSQPLPAVVISPVA
jgi:hypothetical protein